MAVLVSLIANTRTDEITVAHLYIFILTRLSSTRATLVALFCTFSEVFDVPVYWPILVVYFFVLFALTMRRQIQLVIFLLFQKKLLIVILLCRHMIKYKYIPFDIGRKARYGSAK